jgi:hypothetical protein
MHISSAWVLGACLGACASAAMADFHRWVDENGTVHFAETCPAEVECVLVRTLPPPSESAHASAIRRSEELAAQRDASSTLAEQQQADESKSYREERRRRETAATLCERLFAEREILQLTLPVYRDEQQQLHYRDSLHHHWYEGERHYLGDAQRSLQLAEVRQQIAGICAGVDAQRSNYTQRFRYSPPLSEVLGLLDEMLLPDGPQTGEVCAFAHHLLRKQQDMRSGIPASDERSLQRLVNERCR